MINAIVVLLGCQLIGEVAVRSLALPLPGPVAGMALLFVVLSLRRSVPANLAAASDGLLGHLGLLFVPAGVGILGHLDLIRANWPALTVALVVSTFAAMLVTALVFHFASRWLVADADECDGGEGA